MKKIYNMIILVVGICFVSPVVLAQNFSGTVIDVFGSNITTIQFEQECGLQIGDRVDLTYMAGVLPMLIGAFDITAVQENVIIAKPVSLNMPPSNGMTVQVDILKKGDASAQNGNQFGGSVQKKETPAASLKGAAFSGEPQEPVLAYQEVRGEIVHVQGEDIQIAVMGDGMPGTGWMVDVFYVTKDGKDLPVGTWKVSSVEKGKAFASKVKGMGNARKGLKAVMHHGRQEQPPALNVSPGPGGAGVVSDLFSDAGPGIFRDQQADIPPSENLFGGRTDVGADLNQPFDVRFFDESNDPKKSGSLGDPWSGVTFDQYKAELTRHQGTEQEMIAHQIEALGSPRRYWLGVEIVTNDTTLGQPEDSVPVGVRVIRVFPGSPAAKAKVAIADIIYEADGERVTTARELTDRVNASAGGRMKLKIMRDKKVFEKTIRLHKVK